MVTREGRIGREANVGTFENGSGVARAVGDLVVRDEAADSRFTTTTTEGDSDVLGVLVDQVSSSGSGRVYTGGLTLVNVVGSVARGDFLKSSTTAGKATSASAYEAGVFAVALDISGGGQVEAYFFGVVLLSADYAVLLGRAGGQTIAGGTGSGEDLTIKSTSHATRGSTFIGGSSQFELDETTGQVKLPTGGSGAGILLGGDVQLYRGALGRLDIPDAETLLNYLYVGANAAPINTAVGDITAGRIFITNAALDSEARLFQITDAYTPGSGTFNTLYSLVNVTPGAGVGTDDIRAGKFEVNIRPTADHGGGVVGFYSEADHDSGAFDVDTVRGFFTQALQRVGSTTVAVLNGAQMVYRAQAGAVTSAVALDVLRGWPSDAGTITNGVGLRIQAHGDPAPSLDLAIQSLSGEHRFVGDLKIGENTAPEALLDLGDATPGDNFALVKFDISRAWQFETDGADGGGQKLALRALVDAKNFNIQSVGATKIFEVVASDAGGALGFFGTTPAAQAAAYTVTNGSVDRVLDVTGDTLAQVAAVLGTLIADLQTYGLLQ